MKPILQTKKLEKSFGSVMAAVDINIDIHENEIIGVIGANGAGKTTFVNMVTGFVKPTSGEIYFRDRNITMLTPREITNIGITRSFQIPQVFMSATVEENLLIALGVAQKDPAPFWKPLRRKEIIDAAAEQLTRYGITEYAQQETSMLPQGTRKLLDIAMAVVHKPEILLLDEPTSGVSVEEKFGIMDTVMEALREQGVTVLFVEHDMEIIGRYAQRVIAFYDGTIIADGAPDDVLKDSQVRKYVIGEDIKRTNSTQEPATETTHA